MDSRSERDQSVSCVRTARAVVVEVRYDKWQKGRFRHNSRFLRFRPDKNPEQCTVAQVRPRPKKGDPTVAGLLGH